MAELYPNINVKLFNRKDLRDMMVKYGVDHHADPLMGTEAQE